MTPQTTIILLLYGDVSQDGSISAFDASLILQHIAGLITLSPEQQQVSDVTGDGKITDMDAVLILQYTVELITQFPKAAPILVAKEHNQSLTKIIAELENSSLSKEQKQVLEQLRRMLWQNVLPKQTSLLQNYPNPFNPDTWLPFQLAQDASVTIQIHNMKGQLVRTISLGNKNAGVYVTKDRVAYWDGRDSLGEKVSSGVYFYTLQAGEFRATKKMVIME